MKRKVGAIDLMVGLAAAFGFTGGKETPKYRLNRTNWKPHFSGSELRELGRLSGYAKKAYVREIRKKYDEDRCHEIAAALR